MASFALLQREWKKRNYDPTRLNTGKFPQFSYPSKNAHRRRKIDKQSHTVENTFLTSVVDPMALPAKEKTVYIRLGRCRTYLPDQPKTSTYRTRESKIRNTFRLTLPLPLSESLWNFSCSDVTPTNGLISAKRINSRTVPSRVVRVRRNERRIGFNDAGMHSLFLPLMRSART